MGLTVDVQAELAEMRGLIEAQQAKIEALEQRGYRQPGLGGISGSERTTRRDLFKIGGAGVAGAAGLAIAGLGTETAQANDANNVVIGSAANTNNHAQTQTTIQAQSGFPSGQAVLFGDSNSITDCDGLLGHGGFSGNGVKGVGDQIHGTSNGNGVLGIGGTTNGVGVVGQGSGFGAGVIGTDGPSGGYGVKGTGFSGGVVGTSPNYGVVGQGSGGGNGLIGTGGPSGGIGVLASGGGPSGARGAALSLVVQDNPTSSSIQHMPGEFVVDVKGTVWTCISSGTPGIWVPLQPGQGNNAGAFYRTVITTQPTLLSSDGATWMDMDAQLTFGVNPAYNCLAVLTGNCDLWTTTAGYNQDIGIAVSGGVYPTTANQPEAWKESGGFAGTFSPNAAFVQTAIPLLAGTAYTIKLQWKANKNAPGATIVAGAGPIGGKFSPTSLTAYLIPTV